MWLASGRAHQCVSDGGVCIARYNSEFKWPPPSSYIFESSKLTHVFDALTPQSCPILLGYVLLFEQFGISKEVPQRCTKDSHMHTLTHTATQGHDKEAHSARREPNMWYLLRSKEVVSCVFAGRKVQTTLVASTTIILVFFRVTGALPLPLCFVADVDDDEETILCVCVKVGVFAW